MEIWNAKWALEKIKRYTYTVYYIKVQIKLSVLLHTAFYEEEKLPWSGMDLCNVTQNELVDGKDRFCIVGRAKIG